MKSWFVKVTLLDPMDRFFFRGAADRLAAKAQAERIFTDGYAVEIAGTGEDQRFRAHPLHRIKEVSIFFEESQ